MGDKLVRLQEMGAAVWCDKREECFFDICATNWERKPKRISRVAGWGSWTVVERRKGKEKEDERKGA